MRNHDQKTKDMIESVLPSADRRAARFRRRQIHSARRGREAQALRRFLRTEYDDFAPADGDFVSDLYEMVWTRRDADKVGPLTRWAVRRVAIDARLREAPLAEQLAYFRRLLPDNTVGRHALQHIEWGLHYESVQRNQSSAAYRRRAEAAVRDRTQLMSQQVRRILASGQHTALNRRLKGLFEHEAAPHRLLAGSHDIGDFVRETQALPAIQTLLAEMSY